MANRKLNPDDVLVEFPLKVTKQARKTYKTLPLERRRMILRRLRNLAKTLVNKERERLLALAE